MANIDELHPITPETEGAATTPAPVSRSLMLLGTFGTEDAPRALIRLAAGEIATIKPGDQIGRDVVAGITTGTVALLRGTRTRTLTLP